MKVVLVVPAYNEEGHISDVIKNARGYVDKVIVVDDGSADRTYQKAGSIEEIVVLRHKINLGKGAALKTGCEAAVKLGADIIVMMDGDGQHPPEYIPKMIAAMTANNWDAVFCARESGGSMPWIRRIGNQLVRISAAALFNLYLRDLWCGLRAIKAEVLSVVDWQANDYSGEVQMVLQISRRGLRYGEIKIPAVYNDRFKGVMIIDGLKLLARMIIWRIRL